MKLQDKINLYRAQRLVQTTHKRELVKAEDSLKETRVVSEDGKHWITVRPASVSDEIIAVIHSGTSVLTMPMDIFTELACDFRDLL